MHKIAPAMGQLTGLEATSGRPGLGLLNVGTVRTPSSALPPYGEGARGARPASASAALWGRNVRGAPRLRGCRQPPLRPYGEERASGAVPSSMVG
jgi:hypothetical protein